ncbi:MAG: hypothetical protein J7647_02995 [Cyanobacteria bacterium SBLK]|nr:hypothetical protein [Cyanobacteria bacterium SBLK]
MLLLLIIWLGLSLISWSIGVGILFHLEGELLGQSGDREILAIWLGLSVISISLLGVCLVVPLSPGVGSIVAIALIILTRPHRIILQKIATFRTSFSWKWASFLGLLGIIVSAFISQKVTAYDTGFYHFPAIKWLSEYGLVSGVSLLHYPLGYPSSWLALSAVFNAGILTDRAATVMGGFALLLALSQTAICGQRIIVKKQQISDWFFVISAFLCLPILTWFQLPISPSPDVAVVILSTIVTWTILILSELQPQRKKHPFDPDLIPVILAAAAVTSKLSALPLFLIAALFFAFNGSWQWKRVLSGAIIGILLLCPMFLFATIATGCPLFPSSLFCFNNLSWSLGTETVREIRQILQNCARWTCPPDAPPNSLGWDWLGHWLQQEKRAVFLIGFSFVSLLALKNRPKIAGQNYLIGLGIMGTIFVMYGSPYVRIGVAYFFIIPALLLATYCHERSPKQAAAIWAIGGTANLWLDLSFTLIFLSALAVIFHIIVWRYARTLKASFLLGIFCLFVGLVPLRMYLTTDKYQFYWLFPAKIQAINSSPLLKKHSHNFTYIMPDPNYLWERSPGVFTAEDRCWNIELPCTPQLTYPHIRLRNPELGLAGGFARIREP